jgi:hypothetical protein
MRTRTPQERGLQPLLHGNKRFADRMKFALEGTRRSLPALPSDAPWYRQTKEYEVRRDGSRGIGASHSTAEAGGPSPRGPSGGKGELDTWTHCEDR